MKTLIITSNYGRFGNNFIAIMNAIIICLQNKYHRLRFPRIDFFITNQILIDKSNFDSSIDEYIEISGYDAHVANEHEHIKYNISHHEIFDTYIANILNLNYNAKSVSLTLYTRAEDAFLESNIMNLYTPAPLYFYQKVIQLENEIEPLLISKDLANPVAKYLYDNHICKWQQQHFDKDMHILINSETLAISFSTMLYFVILASKALKKLYVPDFVYAYFKHIKINIKEILKDDQELIIIKIDNYPHFEEMKRMSNYSTILTYQPT
jgi:hypothetical protein